MHRFGLALAAGILVAGVPCAPACATGNVLVPSDEPSSSSNSGSSAQQPDSAADGQSSLPALDPDTDTSSAPSSPPADYTPLPGGIIANKAIEDSEAPGPQTVQMQPPQAQSTADDASLSGNLKIDVADKYKWGINDTSSVKNTLGIAPEDVPKYCRLSASGFAQSTGGPGYYAFDVGASEATFLRYGGKLTGISMNLQALCDKIPLPSSARYVVQVGDKYSVFLTQLTCAKPPDNPQHVTLHYEGSGTGKCVYE